MSKINIKHMQDLYELGGGVMRVAADLKVHSRTVERWREHGIPDKFWEPLHKLYGVTPFELFRLNAKIRGYSSKVLKRTASK